jgi:hypothetical protein
MSRIHLRGVTEAKGADGRPVIDEAAARAALASYLYSGSRPRVVDVGNQPENVLKMYGRTERAGRIASAAHLRHRQPDHLSRQPRRRHGGADRRLRAGSPRLLPEKRLQRNSSRTSSRSPMTRKAGARGR